MIKLINDHAGGGVKTLSLALARGRLALFLALFIVGGCRTAPPSPPVDLSEPGWQVRKGQAVWRPNKKAPEFAGDLLLAEKGVATCLVQFTKTPLPIVDARVQGDRWQLRFVPQNYLLAGDHVAKSRFVWLRLSAALAGEKLGEDWRFERQAEGHWRLENRETGEVLEGFFWP